MNQMIMYFSEANNVNRPNNKQLGSVSSKHGQARSKYRPSFSKLLMMVVIICSSLIIPKRLDIKQYLLLINNQTSSQKLFDGKKKTILNVPVRLVAL